MYGNKCYTYVCVSLMVFECALFFEQVDCAWKNVLRGNPVASLDNLSVFAKKEKKEQIAKKRVRYFYSLDLMDFFGHSCRHFYKLQFNFHSTLAMQVFKRLIHKFI